MIYSGRARPLCSTKKELSSLYKIFAYTGTKALEILLLRYHPYCRPAPTSQLRTNIHISLVTGEYPVSVYSCLAVSSCPHKSIR